MKMSDSTIEQFAEDLAGASPAPGGGSAAALCGALGAALASMVANLTLGREKFKESEEIMRGVLDRANPLRRRFLDLAEEDAAAFNAYMAALKLPKATDEEKAARSAAVASAAAHAAEIPLRTLEACAELARLSKEAADHGNPNVMSDAGVAAVLAIAAAKSAFLNVRINLPGIKDAGAADNCRARAAAAMDAVAAMASETEKTLDAALPR